MLACPRKVSIDHTANCLYCSIKTKKRCSIYVDTHFLGGTENQVQPSSSDRLLYCPERCLRQYQEHLHWEQARCKPVSQLFTFCEICSPPVTRTCLIQAAAKSVMDMYSDWWASVNQHWIICLLFLSNSECPKV